MSKTAIFVVVGSSSAATWMSVIYLFLAQNPDGYKHRFEQQRFVGSPSIMTWSSQFVFKCHVRIISRHEYKIIRIIFRNN